VYKISLVLTETAICDAGISVCHVGGARTRITTIKFTVYFRQQATIPLWEGQEQEKEQQRSLFTFDGRQINLWGEYPFDYRIRLEVAARYNVILI